MPDLSKSEIARLRGLARHRRDRREAGRFLVEGPKLVAEVLRSSLPVRRVVARAGSDVAPELADAIGAAGLELDEVAPHALERIASTTAPQPMVAEVSIPHHDPSDIVDGRPVLVAVDLNDPGNVGTLARTAEASDFAALILLGATADPWGPKSIRASAGALFRLPVIEGSVEAGLRTLADDDYRRIGTRMHDATPCDRLDLTGPVAIIVGSEAHGLSDEAGAHVDGWVAIPMAGPTESLNAAMAGTILAYESSRQRRAALNRD